jgi:hypothetical protein
MSAPIQLAISPGLNDRQCSACRQAIAFWDTFLIPEQPLTISVELFSGNSHVQAFANPAIRSRGILYSTILMNERALQRGSEFDCFTTLVHEAGHALIFKHDPRWLTLFNPTTGLFHPDPIAHQPALSGMTVETRYGTGSQFVHWCARSHPGEVMTVFRSSNPYILPITLEVGLFLGHRIRYHLTKPAFLRDFYHNSASFDS